jgi:predicted dehydrogenase
VATPDHWHARMVVDAVEGGKDVYCEKPRAHKIDEGFAVIRAVRRTNRLVQVGMQRYSAELFLEAKRIMDSGRSARFAGHIVLVSTTSFVQLGKAGRPSGLETMAGKRSRTPARSWRFITSAITPAAWRTFSTAFSGS